MILQNLAEYYENLVLQEKVSKSGWCQAKVSHAIELNEDGTIKGLKSGMTSLKATLKGIKSSSSSNSEDLVVKKKFCIIKCSGNGYKVVRSIF